MVRDVLHELRNRSIETGDASEAIPILQSLQTIGLMVSDVGLPGMSV